MFTPSLFNTDLIHLSRLERIKSNTIQRKQKTGYVLQEPSSVVELNFAEFSENVANFCEATRNRSGNKADEYLKKILETLKYVNSINDDIITLFRETDFFPCSSFCIDADHPTLLFHVVSVYATITYFSTPLVSNIVENGILDRICYEFRNRTYPQDVFDVICRLICNVCAESPEARKKLYEIRIFDFLCEVIMSTNDPQVIDTLTGCISNFFPDAQIVHNDHVADAMLEPIKSVILRFIEPSDDIDNSIREGIIKNVISTLSKFCTTEYNIRSAFTAGLVNLLLTIMDKVEKSVISDLLETISVILSLNDTEMIQELEPQINLEFIISHSGRVECDILASLFIACEDSIQPSLELGAVDMSMPILSEGKYDEKMSAALMLSAAILRSSVQLVNEYLMKEEVIDCLLDFWQSKNPEDRNFEPICAALTCIKQIAQDDEDLQSTFEEYEFEPCE